jgi:hypothetical protein
MTDLRKMTKAQRATFKANKVLIARAALMWAVKRAIALIASLASKPLRGKSMLNCRSRLSPLAFKAIWTLPCSVMKATVTRRMKQRPKQRGINHDLARRSLPALADPS